MKEFEINKDTLIIIFLFLFVLSIGFGFGKIYSSSCHISDGELESLIETLGTGDLRFLNENMTLGTAMNIYKQYKPYSPMIAEGVFQGLCE